MDTLPALLFALALAGPAYSHCAWTPQPQAERVLLPAPAPGPLDNPLKGWCTYTYRPPAQPYSMVFRYVPWRELEPEEGRYAFAEWERRTWVQPQARGKRIVFRVYLDYPGQPTGVPPWLLAKGLRMTPYTDFGGGRSPDYDDPRLIAALERFIAALGRRYDGNPRVAFVEMGLLGFWGEWHTYPRAELFASHQTQQRILEAAHRAFRQTLVMTRYADVYTGLAPWLGYFDDSFPADTDGPEAWKFLARMRRTERTGIWKRAPIGGEMMPPEAQKWLGAEFDRTMEMLQSAHFTWIGPYNPSLEATRDPQFRGRSEQMVRRMGYEFALTEIRSPESAARGGRLRVHVSGINQGVAPFYYPWPVELALLDLRANPVERFRLPVDIRTWLPGAFALSADPIVHAPPGRYRLALGIIDPWTRKPGIGFATALDRRNGWTVLTTIRITPRPALRRRRSPEA